MQFPTADSGRDSGTSQHWNGSSFFGRLLSSASAEDHRRAFVDWLRLNLELQLDDLEVFLCSLPEAQRIGLEDRLAQGCYADLVPKDAPPSERMLFLTDLEAILTLRRMS